ncbi:MAG: hypothetical protein JNK57_06475 [Planctomycetaceae bacterium]|nr:hypothetical protein [Planctomycetaceae bacterium]
MNRILKSVLVVGATILGISTLIPNEASAQLFRWRGAFRNSCQPVCCTPTYRHGNHDGYSHYGTAPSYGHHGTVGCCEGTMGANHFGGQHDDAYGQHQQDSYDAQGNRMGNAWNNQPLFDAQGTRVSSDQFNGQPLFDAQGNRVEVGNQMNNQQRFDAQRNRVDMNSQLNNQEQFDSQGNRVDVGNQLNTQSPVDAQGNRVDAGSRLNSQSQLDIPKNRVESDVRSNQNGTIITNPIPRPQVAQGASDVIPPTPIPGIRQ